MNRAQILTSISRFPGRRQLVSRTQAFLLGCIVGALIAWALGGAPL